MKNTFVMIALLMSAAASADSLNVGAAPARFEQYPELKQVLEEMYETASEGASLEYFGYSESKPVGKFRCAKTAVSTESVWADLENLIDTIIGEGGLSLTKEQVSQMKPIVKAQFMELAGPGPFKTCSRGGSDGRSGTDISYYQSKHYSFWTELGYED